MVEIIKLILITFWIIGSYEAGKKYLNKDIKNNKKSQIILILGIIFYVYIFMNTESTDVGIRYTKLDFSLFVAVTIPTLTAMFIGLYSKNSGAPHSSMSNKENE